MIPFLSKFRKNKFEKNVLTENKSELNNPSRGWYKMFYFVVGEEPDWEKVKRDSDESQSLVMLFFDIGKASERELETEDFEYIRNVFSYFEKRGNDIILRIAYDHFGKAIEREPNSFNLIKKHAQEVSKIINDNKKNIFVYQGVLLGNWGEMHTSKHLTKEKMRSIHDILKTCDDSVFLAVRKPSHLRILSHGREDLPFSKEFRCGIYNDGMFGSETDLGTYGIHDSKNAGYEREWLREEEKEFIHSVSIASPVGGETVNNDEVTFSSDEIVETLSETGITYLNCEYDKKLLDKWKDLKYSGSGIWNNESLYDYIGAHLGYRFIISKAYARPAKNDSYLIGITVLNSGFAPLYQNADIYIEIDNGQKNETHIISDILKSLESGASKNAEATFAMTEGTVRVYAKRTGDDRIIKFAHDCDEQGRVTVGILKCLK